MGTKNSVVENKISMAEKLEKVSDSMSIYMYDNGYMLEIGGKDADGDWKTAKIVTTNLDDLFKLIEEVTVMTRDD
jgi:hypothetical protein